MFNALPVLKRRSLLATLLLLQVLTFSCKKDKKSSEDLRTLPVVTSMEFYSYDGQLYTSGPHYYNKSILNNLGVPNSVILINGHNFSQDFKTSSVLFNNISAPAIWGDSTTIRVMIPDQVPPGPVTLTINTNGKSIIHTTQFTIEAPDPQITGLNVPAAMRGGRVIIAGSNFSTTATKTSVTINGTAAVIDSVTLKAVYFKIPVNATSGKIVLNTFGKALTYPTDFNVTSSTFTTINNTGLRLISLDAAGNLYGTDQNMIDKITPGGVSTMLAKIGSDNTNFGRTGTYFGGCVADASGTAYFTSPFQYNSAYPLSYPDFTLKLIKVLPDGSLNTIAGGGSYPTYVDGQGTKANFNRPFHLALDGLTGNFYINDASVIRKVTPSGLVSTVANAQYGYGTVNVPGFKWVSSMTVQSTTGDVYLIDDTFSLVAKITPSGAISTSPITTAPGVTIVGLSGQGNTSIYTSAVNASGTIFLTVGSNLYQIKNGVATNTYANPSGGNILGMAIDKSGNLYLSAAETFNLYNYNTKYSLYKITL